MTERSHKTTLERADEMSEVKYITINRVRDFERSFTPKSISNFMCDECYDLYPNCPVCGGSELSNEYPDEDVDMDNYYEESELN